MKKKALIIAAVIIVGIVILVACNAQNNGNGEADLSEIPVVVDEFEVMAEGRIVPKDYVNLTFSSGGQVAEVMIPEGKTVEAGEVIARLRNEQLAAAVAAAEVELVGAQQAYDDLTNNQDLLTAQAQQAVADAQEAVREAERQLSNYNNGANQANIDSAEANVIILKDRLEKAQEDFDKVSGKPDDNLVRAAMQSRLADAQLAYDAAVRQLNSLVGSTNDIDLAVAEANLAVAEAQLAIAERDYTLWQDGPHPDDLAAAEARLHAAQANLESTQIALADTQLTAPISGEVVSLNLKVGEQVGPGQVAAVVADLSSWKVETDNLTEIEVPSVEVGQSVTIVPDALPDLTLTGTVESVGNLFEEKRGDVTYTVIINLDKSNPALRWGMTVVVTFKE
jgi:multidrug resistance efflux pump